MDLGRGHRAHRLEQSAVRGVGEVLGLKRSDRLEPLGNQEQGTKQGLLGIVDHRRRRVRQQILVGFRTGGVGHHAARTKSSRLSARSTCGAIKWAANNGGTAFPQFVRVLRAHVERFGVASNGRLFQNQAGNYVEAAAYGITWSRAREYVLTRTELAGGLAKRPYDLRHAGFSFWLHSGVDPGECARRAGHSIHVLFKYYAKFLDGVQEQANRLIEQSMEEWDRVSKGVPPAP
ncbi:hypothetical protein ACWC98_33680 [Streptomyces goshikiensis]